MTRGIAVLLIAMCASMPCVLAAAGQEPKPKPRVDRTPPILQKMTPAQRHHAKIYNGRGMIGGRLLDDLRSIEVFSDPGSGVIYAPAAEVFRRATCSSQAVIAGLVSAATSYPSEDGAMLFTEYEVVVSHVLKSTELPQIFNGGKLTVVRIGGVIPIEGTTIEANVRSAPRLRTNDSYLFFLKLLPEPRTFQADTADAAWMIQSGRVKALTLSAPDVDLFGQGVDYSVVSGWVESASGCQDGAISRTTCGERASGTSRAARNALEVGLSVNEPAAGSFEKRRRHGLHSTPLRSIRPARRGDDARIHRAPRRNRSSHCRDTRTARHPPESPDVQGGHQA